MASYRIDYQEVFQLCWKPEIVFFVYSILTQYNNNLLTKVSALSTFDDNLCGYHGCYENKGSIPERKPEKRLPHPRKAVGAQIIHYQNEQIVTKKSGLFLFFSFHQNNQERKISSHKSCLR
ncbi:unnamed protein product [Onchocerca ochengi]|uniref:Uncharacterized protein n=1 Tax=Onchocerca ochengi TaxID=42157 RepID=A0A182E0L4_ONCOC|nr:unnamed protein product [Onchocerca ochengi]